MSDVLLVRVYKVGFGDCIYVQVPERYKDEGTDEVKEELRHILIDCGSRHFKGLGEPRKRALEDVYDMLDDEERRLDLLAVTHKHSDHINGFNPKWLEKMNIDRIWLSAAMKKDHPDAEGYHALQDLELKTLNRLVEQRLPLNEELDAVRENRIAADKAFDALTIGLPKANEIEPTYVYRGFETDPKLVERAFEKPPEYKHPDDYLMDFKEDTTKLWVLAPEWEIDEFYLDREVLDSLRALNGHANHVSRNRPLERRPTEQWPTNISRSDFQRLRTRLWYAALRFCQDNSELLNNASVVLLLEWRGRRLLFTGDAQEKNWNVMWDKVQNVLAQPLDFLKVGHHGSHNGTPWDPDADPDSTQPILDEILEGGKAQVVVSTREGVYKKKKPEDHEIPDPKLLKVLRRRAAKVLRTDKTVKDYVSVKLPPAPDWVTAV